MTALTLRTASRRLPGGRLLRAGLYVDGAGEPLLLVLAVGHDNGTLADLADPREEDRLVLPASALELLPRLLAEVGEKDP